MDIRQYLLMVMIDQERNATGQEKIGAAREPTLQP
jgi:hypothetical protein